MIDLARLTDKYGPVAGNLEPDHGRVPASARDVVTGPDAGHRVGLAGDRAVDVGLHRVAGHGKVLFANILGEWARRAGSGKGVIAAVLEVHCYLPLVCAIRPRGWANIAIKRVDRVDRSIGAREPKGPSGPAFQLPCHRTTPLRLE
jgi:hypothetical protein